MIKIINLYKYYNGKKIFENYNLDISKNKYTFLMGPSGRGKTTLLKILLGIEKPDSGNIQGLEKLNTVAVFQEDRLCERLSVFTNLKLVISHTSMEDLKLIINNHLDAVGLLSEINTPVKDLSGGMKRRVAIVRAMIASSQVVIMDEPFKGLDEDTKQKCIVYIKNNSKNKTFIISTHDEREIEAFQGIRIDI